MDRKVAARREPDLAAYNEDGRRRALVLGFPAESFVVTAEEVKAIADAPLFPWRDENLGTD
jgi:hypothetical protein